MTKREILAVIPARGGSKGIFMKNIAPLYGKPMLSWIIEEAKKSDFITKIVVSTDNDAIAHVARQNNVDVVFQPEEVSGDFSTSGSAVLNTVYHLKEEGYLPDITVFLHCSSPLTLKDDIDGTIRLLINADADSALSVVPVYKYFWKTDGLTGETIEDGHDKTIRQVRQQRRPKYMETGAVYAMKTDGFLQAKTRLFGRTVIYETQPQNVCDIDTQTDLTVAEVLIERQIRQNER